MGTITRGFANNITTSGVFTSSAFNNDSFDNVTAVPSGSVVTDDMVLVSSATASASASIEFTLGSYKEYKFFFVNMHPATNAVDFEFNLSTDNGSNYNVTKTSTAFQAYTQEDASDPRLTYVTGDDLAQSTAFQHLGNLIGNANDESLSGSLHLSNPASTTFVKHFLATTNTAMNNPISSNFYYAGYANTVSPLTNIKFQMSSGNIDAGKILMFGIN